MSDFNFQPAYEAMIDNTPRVKTVSFGDGYEQRVADGINTTKDMWTVSFQRPVAEIDVIDDFFKAKGGIDSFTWTPAGRSEIKVVCRNWSRRIIAPNVGVISTKFEQVFE